MINSFSIYQHVAQALRHSSTSLLLTLPHNARDGSCPPDAGQNFLNDKNSVKALDFDAEKKRSRGAKKRTSACKRPEPHRNTDMAFLRKRIVAYEWDESLQFQSREACQYLASAHPMYATYALCRPGAENTITCSANGTPAGARNPDRLHTRKAPSDGWLPKLKIGGCSDSCAPQQASPRPSACAQCIP
jgi:hypothetical protein